MKKASNKPKDNLRAFKKRLQDGTVTETEQAALKDMASKVIKEPMDAFFNHVKKLAPWYRFDARTNMRLKATLSQHYPQEVIDSWDDYTIDELFGIVDALLTKDDDPWEYRTANQLKPHRSTLNRHAKDSSKPWIRKRETGYEILKSHLVEYQ